MARHVVVGDLRVQQLQRKGGRRSWTIVWPEGTVYAEADRFLRGHDDSGTQRTYAYLLVDHLRWLERECLAFDTVELRDLERYMGIIGAEVAMPLGEPWRVGKRPYGRSASSAAASCLKGFYLHQASHGVNVGLGGTLDATRLPSRVDRRRSFVGHVKSGMPANPLSPKGPYRRHPKMLPDGARDKLLAAVNSARDALVVTWLADGGLGRRAVRDPPGRSAPEANAACGQCRSPHLHICHRPGNPNGAEAKTKHPWRVQTLSISGLKWELLSLARPLVQTMRDESTVQTWRVLRFTDTSRSVAVLDGDGGEMSTKSLVAIREFGEPVYPGLRSVERIARGPADAPWHVVINGENFHVLQALRATRRGKLDLIYIDPPYNTGNDGWIYNDRYVDTNDRAKSSKWLSFMERRLLLARDLLKSTGVIVAAPSPSEQTAGCHRGCH